MQSYKRLTRTFAGALMIGCLLWTCSDDFLEVSPRGALAPQVLATQAGIEGVVLGAYAQLSGRGNYFSGASNWTSGSIQGAEANKGTEDGDFTAINEVVRYSLSPTSQVPGDTWSGNFEGITRANSALSLLAQSEDPLLSDEDRARLSGEARFLRGHYYFQLQIQFGKAPFLLEGLTLEEQQAVVASSNWSEIEADFQYAYDNLPPTLPEAGRANKWAAAAYLAKVYLYQDKWAEARDLFRIVVDQGVTTKGDKYALLLKYSDAFNAEFDNNSESVFAVQAAANSGTVNVANPDFVLNYPYNTGPVGCCSFYSPTFDFVNSFRTSGGLPLLDKSYNDPANRVKSDQGIDSFDPNRAAQTTFDPDQGPLDPRLDRIVGRRGIEYLGFGPHPGKDWIRDQNYAGPYSPKKFGFYNGQQGNLTDGSSWTGGYTALNFPVIRFSDVLLMLAEAEIQTDDLAAGLELINQVRNRAANPDDFVVNPDGNVAADYEVQPYAAFASKDAALQALYFERKLELGLEGKRFFDLRRWNQAEPELTRIINFEKQFLPLAYTGAVFSVPQDLYYPIPQGQIDIQGGDILPQNPGY